MQDEHVPALVSTEWLTRHLNDPGVRLADVRWYLPTMGKHGRQEYAQGHIPGAVFLDLDTELAAPPGSGPGRHPLPPAATFAAAMSRAGIGPETHVVAYDDAGGSTAARLWWLLRYFGHPRVSVLDGGIGRWIAEGRPLATAVPEPPPASFTAQPQPSWVVDREAVQRLSRDATALVLDARAAERYEGRVEPVDPRPGHIPGARSAPFTGNLRAEPAPRLKAAEDLRSRYDALGASRAEQVVVYCGSGVNACHALLAMHLAGLTNGLLY
ncbi:MAG: sulfurtransferase, partial [Chloroflexota bacterium]